MLNEIRMGKVTEATEMDLQKVTHRPDYMHALYLYDGILPTVLYATVSNSSTINYQF